MPLGGPCVHAPPDPQIVFHPFFHNMLLWPEDIGCFFPSAADVWRNLAVEFTSVNIYRTSGAED